MGSESLFDRKLEIATIFLNEFLSCGTWSGICETGLETMPLENDAMREYLSMGQRTGVRVVSVAPLGAARGKILAGDILVEVDGLAVSNEHTVPVELGAHKVDLDYGVLISQKRTPGETCRMCLELAQKRLLFY